MLIEAKEEDLAAIRGVSQDYWDSWFLGDAERMERSLHPDLAKRHIKRNPQTGTEYLAHLTRDIMVTATRDGEGAETPPDQRWVKLQVLDVYGTIASVRCEAHDYIEYLHLAKTNGQWVIVNTLYTGNEG
jgi:hypothetical protein